MYFRKRFIYLVILTIMCTIGIIMLLDQRVKGENIMNNRRSVQFSSVVNCEETAITIGAAVLKDLDKYWPEFDRYHWANYDEDTQYWYTYYTWSDEPGGDICVIISKNDGRIVDIFDELE